MRLLVAGALVGGVLVQSLQIAAPQECQDSYQRSVRQPFPFSSSVLNSKIAHIVDTAFRLAPRETYTAFNAIWTAGFRLPASVAYQGAGPRRIATKEILVAA